MRLFQFPSSGNLLTRSGHLNACPCSIGTHHLTHTLSSRLLPAHASVCTRSHLSQPLHAIDMQHLSCLALVTLWLRLGECQRLPGTEPRAAAQKQLSNGNEPPQGQDGCLPSQEEPSRKEVLGGDLASPPKFSRQS